MGALTGFEVRPYTSMVQIIGSLPLLILYPMIVGLTTYRLALRLREQNQLLSEESRTDGLSGLLNRRYWEDAVAGAFQRLPGGRPVSLLMLDIDHFKSINDQHGHPVGDEVIRSVAAILRSSLRDEDVPGRYGGEFGVLCDTPAAGAEVIAERIRKRIEGAALTRSGAARDGERRHRRAPPAGRRLHRGHLPRRPGVVCGQGARPQPQRALPARLHPEAPADMKISMYQASAPRFANMLRNLSVLLDKAQAHCEARKIDPAVMGGMRLIADMFPLSRQVQIACDTAKGAMARLAGLEIPKHEDTEQTFAGSSSASPRPSTSSSRCPPRRSTAARTGR